MNAQKKISFCITCKNRLHQIGETLKENLDANKEHEEMLEFVLVDFGSTDGLQSWILTHFREQLESGYLKYFFTTGLPHWDASRAKNTAHFLASGDFLVGLDCDNYVGKGGGAFVQSKKEKYGDRLLMHQWNGVYAGGTFGRIGMRRVYFDMVGGYDESFEPMGYQDGDLLGRLHELGLEYRSFRNTDYAYAIPNEKSDSIKFCDSALSWAEMNLRNKQRSITNIRSGKLLANNGVYGIRQGVLQYSGGNMLPVV